MTAADPVRRIADAVLYEGYLLWPYRRSALKNQRRWTFGGVHPRAHSERHPDDRWVQRTECLVELAAGQTIAAARCSITLLEQRHAAGIVGDHPGDLLSASLAERGYRRFSAHR